VQTDFVIVNLHLPYCDPVSPIASIVECKLILLL
jgi:hypothetical protein